MTIWIVPGEIERIALTKDFSLIKFHGKSASFHNEELLGGPYELYDISGKHSSTDVIHRFSTLEKALSHIQEKFGYGVTLFLDYRAISNLRNSSK